MQESRNNESVWCVHSKGGGYISYGSSVSVGVTTPLWPHAKGKQHMLLL